VHSIAGWVRCNQTVRCELDGLVVQVTCRHLIGLGSSPDQGFSSFGADDWLLAQESMAGSKGWFGVSATGNQAAAIGEGRHRVVLGLANASVTAPSSPRLACEGKLCHCHIQPFGRDRN